ncbi:unnamed protein product [Durusdinium trenchii]|uniref:Uncharacterized protein n=1 Tax=Durusdinium trenchii TaxID=1381693 RepID=A0ABP0HS85_9DINO
MMLFLIFSLPPLLVGLRANQNNRRTVDLLWGHATESRAYLCRLEADAQPERAWWDQDIKDVKASIELTESIAQRLRLDTALVVKTLGLELTIGQFTALASLFSTAGVYAYGKLQELKQHNPELIHPFMRDFF